MSVLASVPKLQKQKQLLWWSLLPCSNESFSPSFVAKRKYQIYISGWVRWLTSSLSYCSARVFLQSWVFTYSLYFSPTHWRTTYTKWQRCRDERWCLLGCKAWRRCPAVLLQLINDIYHDSRAPTGRRTNVLTDLFMIINELRTIDYVFIFYNGRLLGTC